MNVVDATDRPSEIERAIASGNGEQIGKAVEMLLSEVERTGNAGPAIAAAPLLRGARRYASLLRLSDHAARLSSAAQAWQLWPHAVQALIELDANNSAERLVEHLLRQTEPEAVAARGTMLALLGRLKKTEYVRTRSAAVLNEAIRAYIDAGKTNVDPMWTGVNAIALRAAANRRSVPDTDTDAPNLNELLSIAATAPLPRSAWAIATELELRLARGEQPSLQPLLLQLFDAHDVDAFVLDSFSRQLREIWELEPSDPLMVMLGERALTTGGSVVLPSDPGGYEKMFSGEFPVPIEVYRLGLDRAQSVGSLLRGGQVFIGTVFAMKGTDLHDSLNGKTVLVTNEHVVPAPDRENGTQASEVIAHFDGLRGPDDKSLAVGGFRAVWHSVREELDITLLVTDDPAVEKLIGLEVAASLPPVRSGAYVYVIGHPGGGSLQLSIRGNDLIDHDDVKLRYKAPTEKGSSGSPVFDDCWNLIGVHHYGGDNLPALNGAKGTYGANEGNAIPAVRAALAIAPPTL